MPAFAGSYVLARDRGFAILTAAAGLGVVLAGVARLGAPAEVGLTATLPLLAGYTCLAWRLAPSPLRTVLGWTARVGVQAVLLLLLLESLALPLWERLTGASRDATFAATVALAWWLGVATYGLIAILEHRRSARYLLAWDAPIALLLTLRVAPWPPAWHLLPLAGLAALYAFRANSWATRPVAIALTALALLPMFGLVSAPLPHGLALLVLIVAFATAAHFRRQRGWAYGAGIALPFLFSRLIAGIGLASAPTALAWALFAVVVLGMAEAAAWLAGEGRRHWLATLTGWGTWHAGYVPPLFIAGHLAWWAAMGFALGLVANAPNLGLAPRLDGRVNFALVLLLAAYAALAASRRTSGPLYVVVALLPVAHVAIAGAIFQLWRAEIGPAELARLLAGLAIAYALTALALEWGAGRYAVPFHLGTLGLVSAAFLFAAGSDLPLAPGETRQLGFSPNTLRGMIEVGGVGLLLVAVQAVLAGFGRIAAYQWLYDRLTADLDNRSRGRAPNIFLLAAVWLCPLWLGLIELYTAPAELPGAFALTLVLLNLVYLVAGWLFARRNWRGRWAWYSAGFCYGLVGLLLTTGTTGWDAATYWLACTVPVIAATLWRRPAWLYGTVLLLPRTLGVVFSWLDWPGAAMGPALV
ncbi:MAG: hypothetical protein K6T74_10325, partial [Geminicoccaceae bacterium]|nr:hypothetical protein [Geminicoccaceae bacterium]